MKSTCNSNDNALALINAVHAAIHKEFAADYIIRHPDRERHIVNTKSGLLSVKEVKPTDAQTPTIPTGPCEVCYGIEVTLEHLS